MSPRRPKPQKQYRRYTYPEVRAAVAAIAAGTSISEVARSIGAQFATVHYWAVRAGVGARRQVIRRGSGVAA